MYSSHWIEGLLSVNIIKIMVFASKRDSRLNVENFYLKSKFQTNEISCICQYEPQGRLRII